MEEKPTHDRNRNALVTTSDGQVIRRTDAVFGLKQHGKAPNLFRAVDGTVYQRQPNGSLVNCSKPHKRKRRR